jgi:hypothetical protein
MAASPAVCANAEAAKGKPGHAASNIGVTISAWNFAWSGVDPCGHRGSAHCRRAVDRLGDLEGVIEGLFAAPSDDRRSGLWRSPAELRPHRKRWGYGLARAPARATPSHQMIKVSVGKHYKQHDGRQNGGSSKGKPSSLPRPCAIQKHSGHMIFIAESYRLLAERSERLAALARSKTRFKDPADD